jgi:hypothetical protein
MFGVQRNEYSGLNLPLRDCRENCAKWMTWMPCNFHLNNLNCSSHSNPLVIFCWPCCGTGNFNLAHGLFPRRSIPIWLLYKVLKSQKSRLKTLLNNISRSNIWNWYILVYVILSFVLTLWHHLVADNNTETLLTYVSYKLAFFSLGLIILCVTMWWKIISQLAFRFQELTKRCLVRRLMNEGI